MVAGTLRIATRGSALARWQADHVAGLLRRAHPSVVIETIVVETTGDRRQDAPIHELGGQGVFVKEVQAALLDERADLAVHSAKDLPSVTAPGLELVAVPCRDDPRDALVGRRLADLPPGATVATGSVRRQAQLAAHRPDLRFVGVRGNIATRLGRVPPGGSLVVAAAALDRLDRADLAAEVLAAEVMVPQAGQGTLAVDCRAADPTVAALVRVIDDAACHDVLDTERAFLARLGGGCDLPVGAWATLQDETIVVRAMLAAPDGTEVRRGEDTGPRDQGPVLAAALADRLAAHGGRALLERPL